MFDYVGVLFQKRNNKIFRYILPIIISIIFIGFSLSNITIPVIYIVVYFIMILFFYSIFKGTFLQIAFGSGNFVFHLLVIRGLILAIIALTYKKCMYCLIKDNTMYMFSLCLTFIVASVFLVVFRRLYSDSKIKVLSRNKNQLSFLVIAQSFLNGLLIVTSISYYYELGRGWASYYHLTVFLLIAIVFYIIFNHCEGASIRIENEIKLEVIEKQLENQLEDYYAQMEYVNSLRKFKHDYKNIISTMTYILENNNIHKAKEFLYDIQGEIKGYEEIYREYSNNPLVQAILTKVGNKACVEGIDFSAEVIFPSCLVISDLDICRVFGNIMDNAIEALMKMDKTEYRYLKVNGSKNAGWFTLIQENNFNGDILVQDNNINTSKKNKVNHGFGINTVRDIVSKAGGILIVKPDKDKKVFTTTLHIPYKED